MVTKDSCEVLVNLPEEAQQFVLAMSIMTNRISTLPPADREDLFQLMTAWSKTGDEDERKGIKWAMIEILTQGQVKVKSMPMVSDQTMSAKSKSWAVHVGATIRKLREKAGLSQVQLAERAGLPQPHLSRLENAAHTATHVTLEKIAAALGVTVGDLDPTTD